jgi:hypothetical protein
MSRSTRRAVSWIGTLAVLFACGVGLAHLPGSGGVADELRWLLAKDRVPSQQFNRAAGLIILAEKQKLGARAAVYKTLLWERDPRVVGGAITLLANDLGARRPPDSLLALFTEWFLASTPEARLRYQPDLLACCEHLLLFRGLDRESGTPSASRPWPLPAAVGDYRWLVAGTLCRDDAGRSFADRVVFRERPELDCLRQRLHFLDADAPFLESRRFEALAAEALTAELRPTVEQIASMVTDADARVRWGAGRILAVAGDARGLPAFCDWLQHNARMSANADKLMTPLFGPDWRDLCASGSATRQSSPGDGRR